MSFRTAIPICLRQRMSGSSAAAAGAAPTRAKPIAVTRDAKRTRVSMVPSFGALDSIDAQDRGALGEQRQLRRARPRRSRVERLDEELARREGRCGRQRCGVEVLVVGMPRRWLSWRSTRNSPLCVIPLSGESGRMWLGIHLKLRPHRHRLLRPPHPAEAGDEPTTTTPSVARRHHHTLSRSR